MERYKKLFREQEDEKVLFSATSRGKRAWIKAIEDIDSGNLYIKSDALSGSARDISELKNKIIMNLIDSHISNYGDVINIQIDELNIGKYWNKILQEIKKYKNLKTSKDKEARQFYWSLIWSLSDAFRKNKGDNFDSILNSSFKKIEDMVKNK